MKQLETLIAWAKKYLVVDDDMKVCIEGKDYKITCEQGENGNTVLSVFQSTKYDFKENRHLYDLMTIFTYDYEKRRWKKF